LGLENPIHWIPIIVVLLLLFGAKRLPEIGRSLGSGLREFKQSINGESHDREQERPTLNAGASPPPVAPSQTQSPQDAPVGRDPAATDQR
jgi:sec-independent protein translocase protein TatA